MIELKQYMDIDKRLRNALIGPTRIVSEEEYNKKCYLAYKEGKREKMSIEEGERMRILEFLEHLGFPMDEDGTYRYKDIIFKALSMIREKSIRTDNPDYTELIEQMQTPYSQFYFDIARNDLGMGVKSFHESVQKALSKVDVSKADPELLSQVCSNFKEGMDYGEQAFALSNYVAKVLKPRRLVGPKLKVLCGNKSYIYVGGGNH